MAWLHSKPIASLTWFVRSWAAHVPACTSCGQGYEVRRGEDRGRSSNLPMLRRTAGERAGGRPAVRRRAGGRGGGRPAAQRAGRRSAPAAGARACRGRDGPALPLPLPQSACFCPALLASRGHGVEAAGHHTAQRTVSKSCIRAILCRPDNTAGMFIA